MLLVDITVDRVVVALIVTLVVGLLVRLAGRLEDRYWEWQYPLATEYLSWFDNWDSSTDEPTRLTVRWRQFGRSLSGKGVPVDGSTQWTQEGEIKNGNIVGTYDSDDPHDDDIGIYFLRIERDGRLVGYWAGQEADGTATLRTGRFELIPKHDDMRTTSIDRETLPVALAIDDWRRSIADPVATVAAAAGEGDESTADEPTTWVSTLGYLDPPSRGPLQRVADRVFDDRPLGGTPAASQRRGQRREYTGSVVASVREASGVAARLDIDARSLPDALTHAASVGLVEVVGLKNGAHGRATALELLERTITQCHEHGATVVCLPVTDADEIVSDVVARLGFEAIGAVSPDKSAESANEEKAAAVVGDGGAEAATTLYIRFK